MLDVAEILNKYFSDDSHYRMYDLLKTDSEYNIMVSNRNDGKSYQVKHYVILDSLLNDRKFVYMRRYGTEMTAYQNTSYYEDVNIEQLHKVLKKFAREISFDTIEYYSYRVWAVKYEKSGRRNYVKEIGRTMELATAGHFKSNVFLNCFNVLFEEFLTNEGYLIGEPQKFQHAVSTIMRDNTGKVFLLGNQEVRSFPYVREWGLIDFAQIKEKEIQRYKYENTNIACELCENTASKRTENKMFFGKARKNIVDGDWNVKEVPHLPVDYKICKSLYKLTLVHDNMKYRMEVLQDVEQLLYLYIYPCITKDNTPRVITKFYGKSNLETPTLTYVLNGDIVVDKLFRAGRVFYADNLTGTEIGNIAREYGLYKKGVI